SRARGVRRGRLETSPRNAEGTEGLNRHSRSLHLRTSQSGGVAQPQPPSQPPQPPLLGAYRMTGPRGPPQAAVIGVVLVVLLLAVFGLIMLPLAGGSLRSEERRVGKECRARGWR